MKNIGIIVLMFFGSASLSAQDLNTFFEKADSFFKTNVANGKVAYSKINSNKESLDDVLKLAEKISVLKDDAKNYQAFWINAYNLSVIKGIIDNYPTKSPLDHAGFFDKKMYSLGGKKITLNDIEHKLLRAQFNDARFHFVLVCGALGCPPLINKAYLPGTLNSQMDVQTRKALNGSFLMVNAKKKRVKVSQIMEWYKKDFTMNGKTEIDFINTYRTEKIPDNFKLSYFPYNWNVNKQ
ncbi:DUF547 domain-containing protein [Flavivirga spongiicola]|uniref:DUF547 domain-containing protein n=1 Tax=Flavivirga spongiicola TaxID=421621 RepID=A0ABU7XQU2_9FLAO|nr:DUF547 domain-containing protein [Flavivirga sp. MEBiC05379]MDO5978155.1 DUF547 domain-containing protein [Flavivirga sp. MEBiC05379]